MRRVLVAMAAGAGLVAVPAGLAVRHELLNRAGGPLYAPPVEVRPGVLRVRAAGPAGSELLDWSCW